MVLTGRGKNTSRSILSSDVNYSAEHRDSISSSAMPFFLRAVVVDIIYDPNLIDEDLRIQLENILVSSPELIKRLPKNTIVAREISNGADQRDGVPKIFYPFFPSHFSLPLKPGETVFIFYENPEKSMIQGFYMGRISEPSNVEDLNFTHADRKFSDYTDLTTNQKASGAIKNNTPYFPNGGDTEDTLTLSGIDDFEEIFKNASANESITYEAVPRFTKRPADTIIQGSNNTLICLGEDRNGPAEKQVLDKKNKSGAIDIVVGRGKKLPLTDDAPPLKTAPPIITNSRKFQEVDKNPIIPKRANKTEGDPDFINDASRLLISMNTDGDKNFELAGKYPSLDNSVPILPVDKSAYIVAKSDEIRIIARKDIESNINGSIKIIKEGIAGDDQAVIMIQPDGTIKITGKKIIIGDKATDQVSIGTDSDFHLILGEELKSILEKILTALASHTHLTPLGPSAPPLPPALVDFSATIPALLPTMLSSVGKIKK